jgi:drug/metabolite transporter (DMT)-like permease
MVCGLIGIALPNTNMYYAAARLPAGLLALLVNTVPIIIYPIALMAKQEKFDPKRLLGLFCAIAGIFCLILPKASFPDAHAALWVLMALLTPLCFALFAVFINPHRPTDSNSLSIAAGMMLVASVLVAPLVFRTHQFYPLHWPFSIPSWIILLEMVLSSLGYVLFLWLLKVAGPVYYSLVDGVVAVTGLLWGIALFNERFNGWHAVAVVLIFSGIAFMTLRQRVNNKKSATKIFYKELPVEFSARD